MSGERVIVEESWSVLAASELDAGMPARELSEFESANGSVLLAQDSSGTRRVLVPLADGEQVVTDTDSRGVQLLETSLNDAGERRRFVDVRCPEPRFYRVFNQIATSMLGELVQSRDEAVSKVCARVLAEWRELLQRAGKPLSRTALRGVFGELYFLSQLPISEDAQLDYWTGPAGAPHDFSSAGGAFEIKTTLRSPARRVKINGVDQLDDTRYPFLTLVVVSLAEDPKGQGLEHLLSALEGKGISREQLLDKLACAGVQEDDLPAASEQRYRVTEQAAYRVCDDLPRLIPSSFAGGEPMGVHNLRYEIDLPSSCLLSEADFGAQRAALLTP